MFSRRVRDQVAKHNWFGAAVDVAIVLVAVFLGLQANNWNNTRTDRNETREYRSKIISSLRANEDEMLARAAC